MKAFFFCVCLSVVVMDTRARGTPNFSGVNCHATNVTEFEIQRRNLGQHGFCKGVRMEICLSSAASTSTLPPLLGNGDGEEKLPGLQYSTLISVFAHRDGKFRYQ